MILVLHMALKNKSGLPELNLMGLLLLHLPRQQRLQRRCMPNNKGKHHQEDLPDQTELLRPRLLPLPPPQCQEPGSDHRLKGILIIDRQLITALLLLAIHLVSSLILKMDMAHLSRKHPLNQATIQRRMLKLVVILHNLSTNHKYSRLNNRLLLHYTDQILKYSKNQLLLPSLLL